MGTSGPACGYGWERVGLGRNNGRDDAAGMIPAIRKTKATQSGCAKVKDKGAAAGLKAKARSPCAWPLKMGAGRSPVMAGACRRRAGLDAPIIRQALGKVNARHASCPCHILPEFFRCLKNSLKNL